MLKEQLEDAATENRNLVEEIKQKDAQLVKTQSLKRDLAELKEANLSLSQQVSPSSPLSSSSSSPPLLLLVLIVS